ncbi:hypothetical protein A9236_08110 [Polynucleobacter sp. QLW-P1DATA-2]|nr:hypothetical protein A9236_08110 [Polynucleobacter sp. QLW-P1DATA-2]OIN02690.1 hypothetical protein A9235_03165 [Polynucleobacter sp. MWH-Tro8-2-5-gr]
MGGYTKGASAIISIPRTDAALNTNATTLLVSVGSSYKVASQVITFASAGVQTNTNNTDNVYSTTGINGLALSTVGIPSRVEFFIFMLSAFLPPRPVRVLNFVLDFVSS